MPQPFIRFVHISDTHLLNQGQILDYSDIPPAYSAFARQTLEMSYSPAQAFHALAEAINALPFPVDFILHTGDVAAQIAAPEDYLYLRETLAQFHMPVVFTPGNHDDSAALQHFLLAQTSFHAYPSLFECGDVQIVCLDSTVPGTHAGRLDDHQLAMVEALCKADDNRPLIIALHHHPLMLGTPWLDELMLENGEALHMLLKRAPGRLRGVFFGHIHAPVQTIRDGVLYSSAPGAWCQFRAWPNCDQPALLPDADPGFNVVTVATDRITVLHHRLHMSSH